LTHLVVFLKNTAIISFHDDYGMMILTYNHPDLGRQCSGSMRGISDVVAYFRAHKRVVAMAPQHPQSPLAHMTTWHLGIVGRTLLVQQQQQQQLTRG
jgi:hypothetical protein